MVSGVPTPKRQHNLWMLSMDDNFHKNFEIFIKLFWYIFALWPKFMLPHVPWLVAWPYAWPRHRAATQFPAANL